MNLEVTLYVEKQFDVKSKEIKTFKNTIESVVTVFLNLFDIYLFITFYE